MYVRILTLAKLALFTEKNGNTYLQQPSDHQLRWSHTLDFKLRDNQMSLHKDP